MKVLNSAKKNIVNKYFIYLVTIIFLFPLWTKSQSKDNAAVRSSNKFAINLYNELDRNVNLFFSPFSISSALAIAVNGANGVTLNSIMNTLAPGLI